MVISHNNVSFIISVFYVHIKTKKMDGFYPSAFGNENKVKMGKAKRSTTRADKL